VKKYFYIALAIILVGIAGYARWMRARKKNPTATIICKNKLRYKVPCRSVSNLKKHAAAVCGSPDKVKTAIGCKKKKPETNVTPF